jgi:4'-phosphopantetheinyl transferase
MQLRGDAWFALDRPGGDFILGNNVNHPWHAPPSVPVLAGGAVHLWRIPLDAQTEPSERHYAVLSKDEQTRAARFHFPKDRRAYVIAHAALRAILGLYTGKDPESLCFALGQYSKPTLMGGSGLHFNLTHSGQLAVVGLSADRELGVDVEQLRDISDLESMAAHYFTPAEQCALRTFPPAARGRAFLDGWTRKEAVMKALGLGVSQPPESIEVSLDPRNAMLFSLAGRPTPDWTMIAFTPGPGYTGAVAMQRSHLDLSCFEWSAELFGDAT